MNQTNEQIIRQLNSIYNQSYNCYGHGVDRAIEHIRRCGVTDERQTAELLRSSHYGHEPDGSVTSLVLSISPE